VNKLLFLQEIQPQNVLYITAKSSILCWPKHFLSHHQCKSLSFIFTFV